MASRHKKKGEKYKRDFDDSDQVNDNIRKSYLLLLVYVLFFLLVAFGFWLAALIGQIWITYTVDQSGILKLNGTLVSQYSRFRGIFLECVRNLKQGSIPFVSTDNNPLQFTSCVSLNVLPAGVTTSQAYRLRLAVQSLALIAVIVLFLSMLVLIVFFMVWRHKRAICDKTYRAFVFWLTLTIVFTGVTQFLTMVLFHVDLYQERTNYNQGVIDNAGDWTSDLYLLSKDTLDVFYFIAWGSIFALLMSLMFLLCGASGCMTWMQCGCFQYCLCCCCPCLCLCNLFMRCCADCDIFHRHHYTCHDPDHHRVEQNLEAYTIEFNDHRKTTTDVVKFHHVNGTPQSKPVQRFGNGGLLMVENQPRHPNQTPSTTFRGSIISDNNSVGSRVHLIRPVVSNPASVSETPAPGHQHIIRSVSPSRVRSSSASSHLILNDEHDPRGHQTPPKAKSVTNLQQSDWPTGYVISMNNGHKAPPAYINGGTPKTEHMVVYAPDHHSYGHGPADGVHNNYGFEDGSYESRYYHSGANLSSSTQKRYPVYRTDQQPEEHQIILNRSS